MSIISETKKLFERLKSGATSIGNTWNQGVQNVKQSNPWSYTPFAMKSEVVPSARILGQATGYKQPAEDIGYGLRGALSLTPFQAVKPMQQQYKLQQQSNPTTFRQQAAQSIGQGVYGSALTAPIAGGALPIVKNAIIGSGLGVGMGVGSDLIAGRGLPNKQKLAEHALSGFQNSWTLPITNAITSKLIKPFAPNLVGENLTLPFKSGDVTKGFSQLFTRALAEVPLENTVFTWLGRMDDKSKETFMHDWMANLPGNIVSNLAFAGIQGTWNTAVNKESFSAVNNALQKTIKDWSLPVTTMELDKNGRRIAMPMWQYKLRNMTIGGNIKDINELSVEDYAKIKPTQPKGVATTDIVPQRRSVPGISEGKVEVVPSTMELPKSSVLSSTDIIPKKGKLNVGNLNLNKKGQQLVRTSDTAQPTVIGNKSVVETSKLTKGAERATSDAEQQKILAGRLNSRQKVVTLTNEFQQLKKSGADEKTLLSKFGEIADQSRIAQQEGTFAGRQLQAQKILADELATPQQKILALLDNAGIDKSKYSKDAIKVDWNNTKQVVEFYRKYVPPELGEVLTEFRYANMLSSPLTHIKNIASNFLQTGVVTPVEKTISGGLDWVKSTTTGSERQYYASDGIKYAKAYYKSLPEGWRKFKDILTGKEISIKPDMERIPTSVSGVKGLYATPLRALEAADKFFATLVKSGEEASLQGRGLNAKEIAQRAENSAEYRLFRQKFDPDGSLGQGYVLRVWDKYNSVVNQLRRLPGGNWIVPFLQTPTNILKQGVEYSPLGLATMPGSKAPLEQLSKTIIGTSVFAAAYGLLNSTDFTWEVPSGQRERDLFYAANMQPYSIKIGNQWVSYSKLGPLAYPIAMAASLRYAEKYNLSGDKENAVSTAIGGMMKFFSDQSYVKQLGDFIDSMQTGKGIVGGLKAEATNAISQLIPYRSFLGWLTRIIDPVNRKSTGMVSSIASQIPGLSQTVEPYYNPITKQPSERSNRFLNALSPTTITSNNERVEGMQKYLGSAKTAYANIIKLPEDEQAAMYKKIKRTNPQLAANILKIRKQEKLKMTPQEKSLFNYGVGDGERAYRIAEIMRKHPKGSQERKDIVARYKKLGLITPDVESELRAILK